MSSISVDSTHPGRVTDLPELGLPATSSQDTADFQAHLDAAPETDEGPPPITDREAEDGPSEQPSEQDGGGVAHESREESSEDEGSEEDHADVTATETLAVKQSEEDLVAALENELTRPVEDSSNVVAVLVEPEPVEAATRNTVVDLPAEDVIDINGDVTVEPDAEALEVAAGGPRQLEGTDAARTSPAETALPASSTQATAQEGRTTDSQPTQENPTSVAASQGLQEVAPLETQVEVRSSSRGDSESNDANRGPTRNLEAAAAPRPDPTEGSPAQRFAEHLFPRGVTEIEGEPHLAGAARGRFLDRVARAVQAAEGRGGPVRMRLYPPELGGLKLELKVQGGALTAKLEAESAVARTVLLDNLPLLRERLLEQGVRIEQFDVDLTDQSWGQPTGHEGEETGQDRSHPSAGGELEEVAEPEPRSRRGDEQLDVVI